MAEGKKEDSKIVAVESEKHEGAMSDPTVVATLKSWTARTNQNGKEHTLQAAADKTSSK